MTKEYEEPKDEEPKPEYTFDLTQMEAGANIVELKQEGNYLIGLTDKGVIFRQYVPQGKILNKVNGKFVLEDRKILEV